MVPIREEAGVGVVLARVQNVDPFLSGQRFQQALVSGGGRLVDPEERRVQGHDQEDRIDPGVSDLIDQP